LFLASSTTHVIRVEEIEENPMTDVDQKALGLWLDQIRKNIKNQPDWLVEQLAETYKQDFYEALDDNLVDNFDLAAIRAAYRLHKKEAAHRARVEVCGG